MANIQLANNLRYLRKQQNMTQADLSEILNISRQAYSNYETSKRTPDLDSLLLLAKLYHVSLDDLVLKNLKQDLLPSQNTFEDLESYSFTSNKKTGNTLYLTDEELEMIVNFRSLSPENRQMVTGFLSLAEKNGY